MTSLLEVLDRPSRTTQPAPCSFVVAIGPTSASPQATVAPLLAAADAESGSELVVVDDSVSDAVRAELAPLVGNVRVLHHLSVLGAAQAIARGVRLAAHDLVVVAFPGSDVPEGFVAAARAWMTEDPGAALTLGETGAVVLRRSALEVLGGTIALEALACGADVADLARRLARAGWRSRVAREGTLVTYRSWSREDASRPAHAYRFDWHAPMQPRTLEPGLNVVGLLDAACGVGDAARRTIEAVALSGVPYSTHAYGFHSSPTFPYRLHDDRRLAYDTNLLALNPDLLPHLGAAAGTELWSRRYTIGMWFWEIEALTPVIRAGFAYLNELWVSTAFLAEAFAAEFERHVEVIPLPVRRREGRPRLRRADFGLDDRFLFLSTFDFGSIAARKNGLGAVRAFTRAFAPGEGPMLVLKTLNASWDPGGWAELEAAVEGRRDVRVLDGYLDDDAMSDLVGLADCYVSLHRAEGFGLTPAEAMAWGRPVVATGYSGNREFMTEANSYLVPYDLVPVDRALHRVYPLGARWAEPREDAAVEALRRVVEHPSEAAAKGALAQRDIRRTNSTEAAARAIAERLGAIAEMRRRPAAALGAPKRAAKRGRR